VDIDWTKFLRVSNGKNSVRVYPSTVVRPTNLNLPMTHPLMQQAVKLLEAVDGPSDTYMVTEHEEAAEAGE
jgi:hypothetical protein